MHDRVAVEHRRLAAVESHHGSATMQATDAMVIPGLANLRLSSGTRHVMLEALHRLPLPGDTIPCTLRFAHGGQMTLRVPVVSLDHYLERRSQARERKEPGV